MLRKAFVKAPVLVHFDWAKEVLVKTDGSDLVSVGILSQQGVNRVMHPVVFYSKKYSPEKASYEINYKKLMAIVRAFKE